MALITLDYFKSMPLGVKGPRSWPDADILQRYADLASQMIEDFCGRKFTLQTYTDVFLGRGHYVQVLRNWPVVSIDSVGWTDVSTAGTGLVPITDYDFTEEGVLTYLRNGVDYFYPGRSYAVTYTAGYAEVPLPVQQAVALQMAELLKPNFGGPMNEGVDLVPNATQQIVDLLEPTYRNRVRMA